MLIDSWLKRREKHPSTPFFGLAATIDQQGTCIPCGEFTIAVVHLQALLTDSLTVLFVLVVLRISLRKGQRVKERGSAVVVYRGHRDRGSRGSSCARWLASR